MGTSTDVAASVRENIAAQERNVVAARAVLKREEAILEALQEAHRIIKEQQDGPTDGLHPAMSVAAPETPATATGPATSTLLAGSRPNRRSRKVTPDIDLSGVHVNFDGARNLLERVIRIAETAPGTPLNVTQVARLLARHGETQAVVHNLAVNVKRAMDGRPDLFERVEEDRATYRYLGDTSHRQETPAQVPAQAVTASLNGRLSEHDY